MRVIKGTSQEFFYKFGFPNMSNKYLINAIETFSKHKLKETVGYDIRYNEASFSLESDMFAKPDFVKNQESEYGLFLQIKIGYFDVLADAILTLKIFESELLSPLLKEKKNIKNFHLSEYFMLNFHEHTNFNIIGKIVVSDIALEKFRDPFIKEGYNRFSAGTPKIYYHDNDITDSYCQLDGCIVFNLKDISFSEEIINFAMRKADSLQKEKGLRKTIFLKFDIIKIDIEKKKLVFEYMISEPPGGYFLSNVICPLMLKYEKNIDIVYVMNIDKLNKYL